jgi:hypothetical protein
MLKDMKTIKSSFIYFLMALPFLPLVMFVIPNAFTLLSEPTDPWYTEYTSMPFILSGMYVYPATAVSSLLGADPTSVGWWFCVLAYTGAISYGVYRWARH